MDKKFYLARNTDSDEMFFKALIRAGFEEIRDPGRADFIVHDAVHPGLDAYIQNKPSFIYPHTPQSAFLWDGILGVGPCSCNFVAGRAAQKSMKAYGYPHRVETIGFSRCVVREFTPTTGNDLLIVPAHPLQHGEHTHDKYIDMVIPTLQFVLKNRNAFGKITLCWNETKLPPLLMERIDRADLVFACNTAGCVSVAMGKPTIFFSELGTPRSRPKDALHPEIYAHFLRFPLVLENMSMKEIMAVRSAPNEAVEHWKQRMIGGQFDAEKFIGVVREYI
jgi:hypothetical protein